MMEAKHGKANLARVGAIINYDVMHYCRWAIKNTTDPYIIQKLKRFAVDPKDIETARDDGLYHPAFGSIGSPRQVQFVAPRLGAR
jgi:hypothetical protein